MAEAPVPYMCHFTESQKQAFQKLEVEMKDKWNISLRWDSKVPQEDKSFLYFFTLRGLDREQICKDLKEFERQFEEIHEEMKKLREGKDVTHQQIRDLREKFDKTLSNLRTVNNSTASSSIYKLTSDILKDKDEVLRCFDNTEIVQSRKELTTRQGQMDDLRKEELAKDKMINSLSNLMMKSIENEPKQAEKIHHLNYQLKTNQEKFEKISEAVFKLMRKLNYMPFDRHGEDPYEYGKETQNLVDINVSMIHKLNSFLVSFEGFRAKESKRDQKVESLDKTLTACYEEILKELKKLKDLIVSKKEKKNSKGKNVEKETTPGRKNETFSKASKSVDSSEEDRDKENESLENNVISTFIQNREMRDECKELLKLMEEVISNANDYNPKINGIIIETLLSLNKHMKTKLMILLNSFEVSKTKENKNEDAVENLGNQIRVYFDEVSGEVRNLMYLL